MSVKARLLLFAALLAAALGAWLVWSRLPAETPAVLTLYGNVDVREVELGFRVAGRLTEAHVDEGERVSQDQPLARLDDEPYREALAAAQARVREAQARLDKLERGTRRQELRQARARVRKAEAAFENAERQLRRYQSLSVSDAVSQKSLDAAETRHEETAAALAEARNALALAVEGPQREDIQAAEAVLAAARAQRDQAQTRLHDTVLRAPRDAIVLTRVREPGSVVGVGVPVYTLSLPEPVYVRAYVSEPNLGKLAPGAAVTVTTDSTDRTYRGTVGFVSPRAEFTPRSVETPELRTDLVYRLRIVVGDGDAGLRQGMPVTITMPLAPRTSSDRKRE